MKVDSPLAFAPFPDTPTLLAGLAILAVLVTPPPRVATAAPICGPYQVWVERPTRPAVGDTITVRWSGPADVAERDWIGLYRPGATNLDHLDWKYVDAAAGSITLRILAAGAFEVRYLLDNGFTAAATSGEFTVHEAPAVAAQFRVFNLRVTPPGPTCSATSPGGCGKVHADWTALPEGPANWFSRDDDWIGLYRVGAPDSAWLDYVHVRRGDGARTSGSTEELTETLDLPPGSGRYELRYMLHNTNPRAAISPPFQVGS